MAANELILLILAGGCLAALVACACLTGGCAVLIVRAMQSRPENKPQKEAPAKISRGKETETDEERRSRIAHENLENFGTGIPQQEVI